MRGSLLRQPSRAASTSLSTRRAEAVERKAARGLLPAAASSLESPPCGSPLRLFSTLEQDLMQQWHRPTSQHKEQRCWSLLPQVFWLNPGVVGTVAPGSHGSNGHGCPIH